jgi:hypothetical protein
MSKLQTAEWYRQQAEECVNQAKASMRNEDRARHYAMAEDLMRLAAAQTKPESPPAANLGRLSEHMAVQSSSESSGPNKRLSESRNFP